MRAKLAHRHPLFRFIAFLYRIFYSKKIFFLFFLQHISRMTRVSQKFVNLIKIIFIYYSFLQDLFQQRTIFAKRSFMSNIDGFINLWRCFQGREIDIFIIEQVRVIK